MQVVGAHQALVVLVGIVVGGARAAAAVILFHVQAQQQAVDVLHIADVAAEADDGFPVEALQALDVGEAGQGAVGGEVVGGDDDAILELDGDDGGAGDDGGLGVGGGEGGGVLGATVRGGEVGGVVVAVDVVAGL